MEKPKSGAGTRVYIVHLTASHTALTGVSLSRSRAKDTRILTAMKWWAAGGVSAPFGVVNHNYGFRTSDRLMNVIGFSGEMARGPEPYQVVCSWCKITTATFYFILLALRSLSVRNFSI